MRSAFAVLALFTIGSSAFGQGAARLPIHWRIGKIDSRFALTRQSAHENVLDAIAIWEQASGRRLFVEDEKSGAPIDWIYDTRQQKLASYVSSWRAVDESSARLATMKRDLDASQSRWQDLQTRYRADAARLDIRVRDYNAEVARWNALGGASDAARAQLDAEAAELRQGQDDLDSSYRTLEVAHSSYNTGVDSYNAQVASHNGLVSRANALAAMSAEQVGVCELFGARVKDIHVFAFASRDDLIRTLAHELGHALGLHHVPGHDAIMSAIADTDALGAKATHADMEELHRALGMRELAR